MRLEREVRGRTVWSNTAEISKVWIINLQVGLMQLDVILKALQRLWRGVIRRMTKLITHVKITILPMLGRANCHEPGLVIGKQLGSCCKYQTTGYGGLQQDNVKEEMKISEWNWVVLSK